MNYRLILQVPEGLTFDMLTQDQQEAIASVFGQYVMPMPGTQPAVGMKVVDAVTAPNFNPANMAQHGLSWPILGMWSSDGNAVIPLDEAKFLAHLPPVQAYDNDGNPAGEAAPATMHEPHSWAGWQEAF
jgi:hypothetical protein